MTNLTKYEMETIVNYNVGGPTATVYIRDKSVIRQRNLRARFLVVSMNMYMFSVISVMILSITFFLFFVKS